MGGPPRNSRPMHRHLSFSHHISTRILSWGGVGSKWSNCSNLTLRRLQEGYWGASTLKMTGSGCLIQIWKFILDGARFGLAVHPKGTLHVRFQCRFLTNMPFVCIPKIIFLRQPYRWLKSALQWKCWCAPNRHTSRSGTSKNCQNMAHFGNFWMFRND